LLFVTAIELYHLDLAKSIMKEEHPAADNVILADNVKRGDGGIDTMLTTDSKETEA
jgi:hypothetical protein